MTCRLTRWGTVGIGIVRGLVRLCEGRLLQGLRDLTCLLDLRRRRDQNLAFDENRYPELLDFVIIPIPLVHVWHGIATADRYDFNNEKISLQLTCHSICLQKMEK